MHSHLGGRVEGGMGDETKEHCRGRKKWTDGKKMQRRIRQERCGQKEEEEAGKVSSSSNIHIWTVAL